MKKVIYLMAISLVTIGLASCGSHPEEETKEEVETTATDTTAVTQ